MSIEATETPQPNPESTSLLRNWIETPGWIAALLLLFSVVVVFVFLRSPWGPVISSAMFGTPGNAPLCHKQLIGPVLEYANNDPRGYLPNAEGSSDASFAVISKYHERGVANKWMKEWSPKYKYVAGLRKGDPGELVLFYLAKPTRWVSHVVRPKAWDEEGWIVCPLDLMVLDGLSSREYIRQGEKSETLTNEQFRERLQKTLDFLKANQRPNWEVVVQEHQVTLNLLQAIEAKK